MRAGLTQLLERRFPSGEVEEANDAGTAMQIIARGKTDLTLLDIDLPGRSGLDLIADILSCSPRTRILMLSGQNEQEFGQRAVKAGAHGYIAKANEMVDITRAIERVLQRGKFISPDLASTLADHLQGKAKLGHEELSSREFEVLRMFGGGFSPSEIAEKLALSPKTVSTYRARILEKLGLHSTGDIVRYAVLHGIA